LRAVKAHRDAKKRRGRFGAIDSVGVLPSSSAATPSGPNHGTQSEGTASRSISPSNRRLSPKGNSSRTPGCRSDAAPEDWHTPARRWRLIPKAEDDGDLLRRLSGTGYPTVPAGNLPTGTAMTLRWAEEKSLSGSPHPPPGQWPGSTGKMPVPLKRY